MAEKKLKTLITFVQDETGSMGHIEEATVSAFNEYFDGLRKEKGLGSVSVLVMQFSDAPPEERVRILHDGPLAKVPTLDSESYRPRGVTPLLDAVGTAIKQAEGKEVDRHLLIVQTDGIENASRDFTYEQIAKLVKKKEKAKNWTLVFLGAGVNQWARQTAQMGATLKSTMGTVASAGGMSSAYAGLRGQTVSYLASTDLADKGFAGKAAQRMKEDEEDNS